MSANGTLINAQKVVNLSKSHKKECWRLFRNPLHVDCFGEANHTDLSRFYPLRAAAYRGYLRHNAVFQNVGMTANPVTPIPQIHRYVSHCEPASEPAHHRQCDTPAASPGGCDTPDALPSFRTNCDLCSSPAVSLP